MLDDLTDWTHDEKFVKAKIEIVELYKWWKERIEKENSEEIDPIWTENQYEEDNEMLIRLIKVRQFLWT